MPGPKKAILLLPGPDHIQLTNVHRYVSERQYTEVYTKDTIAGKLDNLAEKIVIIGHGDKSKLGTQNDPVSIQDVCDWIIASGANLTSGNLKIAFDTCYAASPDSVNNTDSVLLMIKTKLSSANKKCILTGAEGPSMTGIGHRYYLTPDDDIINAFGLIQSLLVNKHNLSGTLFTVPSTYTETSTSSEIKLIAQTAHSLTRKFFEDMQKIVDIIGDGLHDKVSFKKKVDVV